MKLEKNFPTLDELNQFYAADWEEHRPDSLRVFVSNADGARGACVGGVAKIDPGGFWRAWVNTGTFPHTFDRCDNTKETAMHRMMLAYHILTY